MNPQSESANSRPSSAARPEPAGEKPSPGRPRVLDQSKRSQITAMVAGGCSLRDAAHFVRCSYHTVRRELKRDPQFKEELRRSELYAQLSPLRAMQHAISTHWRAAAWFLERAYPERFGRRDPAALGPRQARELYDAVRGIIQDEVLDPMVSIRIEERLRAPFRCFLKATGQNARTSRDLREVLKSFEENDLLRGMMSSFGFSKPTPSSNEDPEPGKNRKEDRADPSRCPTTSEKADLQALKKLRDKLRNTVREARQLNTSLGAAPQAPPPGFDPVNPAPESKTR